MEKHERELVYEIRVRFDSRHYRVRDVDFDTRFMIDGVVDNSVVRQEEPFGKVTIKRVK